MARVFAESYLEHHPGAQVFTCVVDEPSPGVAYGRFPFTTVFARDLGIPAFRNMAFRYDVMELNTAVKPYFLAYLRDNFGLDRVLYFDPDIMVFDRLEDLEQGLHEAPMLLTPHITAPLEDNRSPSERLIRQVGVYNLGFLGVRLDSSTSAFLDWWQRRLYRFSISDPSNGLFVDQSWMDLAPSFVDGVRILRDPIYNVAYWNLAHRFPRFDGGRWTVDGRRLGFFHFSGFDAEDVEMLSKHQNRFRLRDRPELRPLLEDYRRRLNDSGFFETRNLPYSYATFDGLPMVIPRFLRRTLLGVDPRGERWPDPFATDVEDSFLAWLEHTDEYPAGALPRAALALWEERWDLKVAFPDVTNADLGPFVRWLKKGGAAEAGLWPAVAEFSRDTGTVRQRYSAPLPAKNWKGVTSQVTPVDLRRPGHGFTWLNQPVAGLANPSPRLTTAALLLHEMRPDVQSVFPDPRGEDQAAYAYWFVFHGAREARLDRRLVDPVARTLPLRQRLKYLLGKKLPPAPKDDATRVPTLARPGTAKLRGGDRSLPWGVNLAGYFDMDTGVGQAARGSLAAFAAAGVPIAKVPLEHTVLGDLAPDTPPPAPFAVSLVHANADQSRIALAELAAPVAAGSIKVGYWFWELSHFPLYLADRFLGFDEIWAPTEFCASAYRALASVPVRVVPPCVLPPAARAVNRSALGLDPDRFYFFFSFDVASVPERKHPLGALDAIERLMRSSHRPVGLVLRILRGDLNPGLTQRIRSRCQGLPVVLIAERSSRDEFDALLSACDACLSLHRSEGLGMLPIETMYLGKPVVATAYGGVTDYLDDTTGFPVEFRLRHLEKQEGPYPAGAVWAEPSIEDAVVQMRTVLEHPDIAAERAARGLERVRSLYSVEAAAARFTAEIRRLVGGGRAVPASQPAAEVCAKAVAGELAVGPG